MADDKTSAKGSEKDAPDPVMWRFTGAYPTNYTPPDRVSRWVSPGDDIEWPGGPPDGNWEPVDPPEDDPKPEAGDQSKDAPVEEPEPDDPPDSTVETAPSASAAEKE